MRSFTGTHHVPRKPSLTETHVDVEALQSPALPKPAQDQDTVAFPLPMSEALLPAARPSEIQVTWVYWVPRGIPMPHHPAANDFRPSQAGRNS